MYTRNTPGTVTRSPLRSTYTPPRGIGRIPAGGPASRKPTKGSVIGIAVAVIVVALLGTMLVVIQQAAQTSFGAVIVEINGPDGESASNGMDLAKPIILQKAAALAEKSGGTITFIRTDGNKAQVTSTVDLKVEGPDGAAETDDATRDRVIGERIDQGIQDTLTTPTSTPGRAILPLQTMAATLAPEAGLPFDIIYVGFGLGDQDPLDQRQQVEGMDPSQSVASVNDKLVETPGAVYSLIFTAAAGQQEPLNTTTKAWRKAWWEQMAAATGASIGSIDDRNIPATPAEGSPQVGPIPNIPETTVPGTTPPPPPAVPTPEPAGPILEPPPPVLPVPPAAVLLAGALFQPDSKEWVNEGVARAQLQPLADAWNAAPPDTFQPLNCVGRTAMFGDAESAQALSEQRSLQALELARSMGITGIAAPSGLGFDDPLPGDPKAPAQRSVTCQLTPTK